jgi:hypothetical protein
MKDKVSNPVGGFEYVVTRLGIAIWRGLTVLHLQQAFATLRGHGV